MKQLQNQNSMTDKKTTIGVIGCSTIAANSVIPAIKSSKNIELTSIGSRNQEKSKKFAEQFGSKKFGTYQTKNLLSQLIPSRLLIKTESDVPGQFESSNGNLEGENLLGNPKYKPGDLS